MISNRLSEAGSGACCMEATFGCHGSLSAIAGASSSTSAGSPRGSSAPSSTFTRHDDEAAAIVLGLSGQEQQPLSAGPDLQPAEDDQSARLAPETMGRVWALSITSRVKLGERIRHLITSCVIACVRPEAH